MSWLTFNDEDEPYSEYADHQVRERPNPKANRPRTKRRPEHQDSVTAMVIGVDRGRYTVLVAKETLQHRADPTTTENNNVDRIITATRARELRNTSIVTGDRVEVVGDISGDEGSLARIVRVNTRTTLLRRSADDSDRVERVIVANADQMLIVVAAANPEPRVRLVDRYLVAAYDAGLYPMICITKTDLTNPEPFLQHFEALDVPVFSSAEGHVPVDELRSALSDHETVFVGHSGVGKSTLINALVPNALRATGDVNVVTGRGRHTSSSTVALALCMDQHASVGDQNVDSSPRQTLSCVDRIGWVIDTPGVRSFGLGHVTNESILRGFTDLAEIIVSCPRGCTHTAESPDCALDAAIASGRLDSSVAARIESLRRLLS